MSFGAEIREEAADEPIEAIVIGAFGWGTMSDEPGTAYGESAIQRQPPKRGIVLSWEEAEPMLDYGYDTGYGAPQCDAIYAYTAKRIIFVSTYDGSTSIQSLPRNPEPSEPEMFGGG